MKKTVRKENDKPEKSVLSRSIVRIAVRSVYLVIAGITLSAASYAWFSRNSEVDEMATTIVSAEADLKITSFAIIRAKEFNDDNVVTAADISREDIELNDFDSVFGKNSHTPVFIRIELEGFSQQNTLVTLSVELPRENVDSLESVKNTVQNGLYYVGENNSADTEKMATYLSNIIQVQWTEGSELNGITEPLDFYNAAAEYEWSDAVSFYNIIPEAEGRMTSLSGITKNESLVIDDITLTPQDGKAVFFLKLDYSWPLVEAFVNMQYSSVRRLDYANSESSRQDFTGDISRINVGYADPVS